MKLILGFFIILLFYIIGQGISYLIGGFIPGSIIGMILLFTSLQLKVLNKERVESISLGLTSNMAIFFIPAGVGLLTATHLLKEYWISILTASAVSTVLVIIVVAWTQEKLENKKDKNKKN